MRLAWDLSHFWYLSNLLSEVNVKWFYFFMSHVFSEYRKLLGRKMASFGIVIYVISNWLLVLSINKIVYPGQSLFSNIRLGSDLWLILQYWSVIINWLERNILIIQEPCINLFFITVVFYAVIYLFVFFLFGESIKTQWHLSVCYFILCFSFSLSLFLLIYPYT